MHVLLDFDGTITQDDTINALGSAAAAFQQQQHQRKQVKDQGEDWTSRWATIVGAYIADHKAHVFAYEPAAPDRTDLVSERCFLSSLRDTVDIPSIQRVRDSRLFAGLTSDWLIQAGRDAAAADTGTVRLRAGFPEFLDDVSARRGWPISIVSINWSDAWIRGVIEQSSQHGQGVRIFSNTVTMSGNIVPNFQRSEEGRQEPLDPLEPLASCNDKQETMGAAANLEAERVVYIGDSLTDLVCLVEANAGGIVMTSDGPSGSSTLKTLARLRIRVPHVSEAPKFSNYDRAPGEVRLAWAADFDEILSSGILD